MNPRPQLTLIRPGAPGGWRLRRGTQKSQHYCLYPLWTGPAASLLLVYALQADDSELFLTIQPRYGDQAMHGAPS